ncbi:MAG: prepilin-type N-terminal cleavage/methylation domain-containing protein, partial [Planctomycetota bacterium]|nr:prepilin-type N-terminal cleavage/methylation domain-containing protein [Planctomycetota bacterium]
FTLIELIVVITVLAVLASYTLPNLDNFSPKYRLRAAARTVGQTVGWARSLGGGLGEEYVVRYDLDENTITIILPPAEDEDPDLDIDLREDLGAEMMPIGIEIHRILHADGNNDQFGIVDIVLDEYGSSGTHIAILTNEIEESIAVSFQAILGTVDYLPGADAEIPQW